MSKKAKIWMIIGIVSIPLKIILFIWGVMSLIAYSLNTTIIDKVDKKIKKYSHDSSFIYTDYGDCYYLNNLYKYEYDILWIDDNHLLYKKNNKIYCAYDDKINELLVNDIDFIKHGSLFLKDNSVYFLANKIYYSYDLSSNTLNNITEGDYYQFRDGNKYVVSSKIENDMTKILITDKNTNMERKITTFNLRKNGLLDYIGDITEINLFNYFIFDDIIYLYMYADGYSITAIYDFDKGKINICDWFFREESRTCYLAFKINDINNVPVLKEYIK